MTSTTMRHHIHTLAYLPRQKEQRINNGIHAIRLRTSRRRVKQALRQFFKRRITPLTHA